METPRTQECFRCLFQRKEQVVLEDNIQATCKILYINNQKSLPEAASIQVTVLSCKTMIFRWSLLKMQITITEFSIKNKLLWMVHQLQQTVTLLPFLGN